MRPRADRLVAGQPAGRPADARGRRARPLLRRERLVLAGPEDSHEDRQRRHWRNGSVLMRRRTDRSRQIDLRAIPAILGRWWLLLAAGLLVGGRRLLGRAWHAAGLPG